MKVKVGNTNYELIKSSLKDVTEKYYSDDKDVELAGFIHRFDTNIHINNQYSTQIKKQSFWHETVHAMLYEIGAVELNSDEGFVEALGQQLYGLFENNKVDKIYQFLEK